MRPELEELENRVVLTAWSAIGPAPLDNGSNPGSNPVSGRVTGIAADPHDVNTAYIATAGGGVWKTTNATTSSPTWTPLTDNLTDSSGNPIPLFMGAVAETDATSGIYSGNQIVYAGTGEANNSGDSYYGEGILVSTDGGNTWTLTTGPGNAFNGLTVSKIAIDPSDHTGATAFAAVADHGTNGLSGNTGIWKTTDFGRTWINTTAANKLSTIVPWSDVVIDPHTPTTLYAAEGGDKGANSNGVYKSTDGGNTWTLLNNGPTGNTTGRITLALYDDGTTDALFVAVAYPTSNASMGGQLLEMVESTDGGNSFTTLNPPNDYMGGSGQGQGGYDTTLAVAAPATGPINTSTLYVYAGGSDNDGGGSGDGNIESFDGGNSWQSITQDANGNGPHTDDHAVAFDASGGLLDGNDGGISRLNDPTSAASQTWSDLNTNLQTIQFTGIAVDPTNSTIAFAGSQDNGTEQYTGSLAWYQNHHADGGISRIDPTNPNVVYQASQHVDLRRSTDGGNTFKTVSKGIVYNTSNGSPIVDHYAPYVLDASGNIYYGTDYLNLPSDQGANWVQSGTPGMNNFNPGDAPIDAIAVNPVFNSNVVYVSAGGKLFITQNAQSGSTAVWAEIDLPGGLGSGAGPIHNTIAVDPADPTGATAYVVVNSFESGGNHVFETTNFGATWTDISGNLPNTPVDSVAVSPDGKTVYIGTDVGVYSTGNVNGSSTSWSVLGTGLPNTQVVELDYVAGQNVLVAAAHGRGAYLLSLAAPEADLSVTASGPATVTAGANATYTITLVNKGPSDAQNVSLTDAVPSGATFVSQTQTGGPAFTFSNPPVGGTGTITATISSLAAGASATFTVLVQANANDVNGSTITNSVSVSSSTTDPNPGNNTATTTTIIIHTAPPPSLSVAFGPSGEDLAAVSPGGVFAQFDETGLQALFGGVQSASVAYDAFGNGVADVVYQNGILVQFDAGGTHVLFGDVQAVSVGFGPFGEVLDVVFQNGSLMQFDDAGIHPLMGNVQTISVAFGPQGEVLDIIFRNGTLMQFDSTGAHTLLGDVQSVAVAISPAGNEVIEVLSQNGQLAQLDAAGFHPLLGGVQSASVGFLDPTTEVLDVIFQDGSLFQYDPSGAHFLGKLA